ncbi:MAG: hypothetical protein AVDCRST_MAG37-3027 [uncultured Rubrobacteraceae bacterium]|uniref:Uncharacterized protein n=1 Tax=uncultured Rubrobacteraceae bacterium TaxID=349277 RepID=A0A6J4QZ60_9ACTN|nr:MAG: hypothetical protein AVDCRST_MAG37-3027 [uncultured Rubrobacteraceae bacterium]
MRGPTQPADHLFKGPIMEASVIPLSFVAGTLLAVQAGANTYMY